MTRGCPRTWQVDALRDGGLSATDAQSFARHRAACPECRSRLAEDERLRDLGRRLQAPRVDDLHVRRLRQQILAAASAEQPTRSRRWRATLVAAPLAVVALFALSRIQWSPTTSPPVPPAEAKVEPFGAEIDGEPGAIWTSARLGATEQVRIEAGTVAFHVRHRAAGERFLVKLPDGEIEVKGTWFRVEVAEHTTRSVRVTEGVVALRLRDAAEIELRANEIWNALPPPPAALPALGAVASARDRVPSRPVHAAQPPSPARAGVEKEPGASEDSARAYEEAVDLFESGRYAQAARALHDFATGHPGDTEAEDAAFMEASALARAGRLDAAAVVAERFLDRYPRSLHAPDAATLAIRAARERGDCAQAHALAEKWLASAKARAAALGACVSP